MGGSKKTLVSKKNPEVEFRKESRKGKVLRGIQGGDMQGGIAQEEIYNSRKSARTEGKKRKKRKEQEGVMLSLEKCGSDKNLGGHCGTRNLGLRTLGRKRGPGGQGRLREGQKFA